MFFVVVVLFFAFLFLPKTVQEKYLVPIIINRRLVKNIKAPEAVIFKRWTKVEM